MGVEVPAPTLALYVVSMTLGFFARGLTGAGNAIVIITIWAIVGVLVGTRVAGPLDSLVAIEGVTSAVCNTVLFLKIRAWELVDWNFAGMLLVASTLASPLGVLAITICDQSMVELIAGALLLAVTVKTYWRHLHALLPPGSLWAALQVRYARLPEEASALLDAGGVLKGAELTSAACVEIALELEEPGLPPPTAPRLAGEAPPEVELTSVDLTSVGAVVMVSDPGPPPTSEAVDVGGVSGGPERALAPTRSGSGSGGGGGGGSGGGGEGGLLGLVQNTPVDAAVHIVELGGEAELASDLEETPLDLVFTCLPRLERRATGETVRWGCWAWEVWAVKQSMLGFAAGMGNGFLGGMVGIGGPPLFILYQYLGTPKEQARAIGILLGSITPRPVLYITTGFLKEQDLPLAVYVVCAALGVVGGAVGDRLSSHVNQARFDHCMNFFVVNAAFLMLASGFGLLPT